MRLPTTLLKEQETLNEKQRKKDQDYLKEVLDADSKLGLGGDTYAMAFKAFNYKVMEQLDMDMEEVHNAFHAAMFVFCFQILMIYFVGSIIFADDFVISMPSTINVLGARFVCTILMHLQVESDMRQALRMMKYVSN